jgi:hypothetical protein
VRHGQTKTPPSTCLLKAPSALAVTSAEGIEDAISHL